jgi:hypothetical protein
VAPAASGFTGGTGVTGITSSTTSSTIQQLHRRHCDEALQKGNEHMEAATLTDTDLVFTDEQLDAATLQAYMKAGLVKLTREGDTVIDTDAMKDKAFDLVTSRIVSDRTEMATHSWTQGELYSRMFPGAPGTDPNQLLSELNPLEQTVRSKLTRTVWTLTNPNRKGNIQSRLGKEGRTEVLVRTKVQRGVDEIVGVFITNDSKLIMEESVQPMVEKLYNVAKEVRLHNDLVIESRHPELAGSLGKVLDVARKRVNAELNRPSAQPAASLQAAKTESPEDV